MLTGRAYVESLRDGREVWYDGERVPDVTTHPVISRCVENRAREYDLHHDPAYRDQLQVSPPDGAPYCIVYHNPQSAADLVRYRQALELVLREAGGGVADHLHFSTEGGPGVLIRTLGLATTTFREAVPAELRANLERFYTHCRQDDVTLTVANAEVKGDRRKMPWEQEKYLQVVDETDRGLVFRGVRKIATGLAYGHDLFVGSGADLYRRGPLPPDPTGALKRKFFLFAVPLDTPGLKVVCRPAEVTARHSRVDCPSSWYDELDGMAIFDDALVPWERIFCYGDPEFLRAYGPESGTGEYAHCITTLSRLELLVGAAYLLAQENGELGNPTVQEQIADLLLTLETVRACIRAAELDPTPLPWGVIAGEMPLRVALSQAMAGYYRVQKAVRDLAGGHVTTNQTYRDLTSPEIGPWVEMAFAGAGSARDRFALLNLVEDLTASEYATRKEQFLMFSLGPPQVKRLGLFRMYDFAPLVQKVQRVLKPD
jgi:aromatic ring hydroxylase